jgi:hypothetical protein
MNTQLREINVIFEATHKENLGSVVQETKQKMEMKYKVVRIIPNFSLKKM